MPPFVNKANIKRHTKRMERRNQRRRELKLEKHTSVMESNRFDILGNLPAELFQNIFTYLNPSDLRNALRICRKWKDLASDDYFWKQKCKLDNYLEMKKTLRSKVYEKFIYKSANYWKRVYVYNEALHQNWRNYDFKEMVFDFPRGNPVVHYLDDEILIMTNDTRRIFVYNYSAEEFLHVFPLRANGYHDDIIRKTLNFVVYSHMIEKLLIVWCINTGLCKLNMILQDQERILDVIIDKTLVAVLFVSGSCQIVNILSGKVELKTKTEDLNCVCFHEDQIAFGTHNGFINIMNWADKMITTTLICCPGIVVYRIMINCDYLISFSSNDICVWSLHKKTKLLVITRDDQLIIHQYAVFLNSTSTLLAMHESKEILEAWDIRDGTRKFDIALQIHITSGSVVMNDHYVFAICLNKIPSTMKMWCKKTGKYLSNVKFNCEIAKPLVTNTKFIYFDSNHLPAMHIRDFEKKIKLKQLNFLNA